MSQHITGNVGQSVSHEDGPFLTIGVFRVRQSLIQAYCVGKKSDEANTAHGVNITFSNGQCFIGLDNEEAAQKEVERLDWLFKKYYQGEQ